MIYQYDYSFSFRSYINKNSNKGSICVLPKLKLIGHNKHVSNSKCKSDKNWGSIVNGRWIIDEEIKFKHNNSIECKYRNITRKDDFHLEYSDFTEIHNFDKINSDLFEIKCQSSSSSHEIIHYQIIPRKIEPMKIYKNCKPLNFLLYSFDSVSRVSWLMRLNKTNDYMFNKMNFQLLNGMNIIGDGTPPFFFPVLTGKTEKEQPSTLKNDPKGKYIDEAYQFIFKELENNGIIICKQPHRRFILIFLRICYFI